ncbi:hypothetical protein [Roseospira navarrensis]|uniref:Uncharacterized protein n=1 Tax=Roseospira navarrensis TaxID=140058 RepID=A0A7X2D3X3_9PROT|nr:hypothetical protein [Roseospira navarrensis]MQX37251.1 hypothetical protein [Roseospira navarrensis]
MAAPPPESSPRSSPRSSPGPNGIDPVNVGCNVVFALLLLIPAVGLVVAAVVAVASVPLMVALFPTALTLGGIAVLVLYIRHRRERRRPQPPRADETAPPT